MPQTETRSMEEVTTALGCHYIAWKEGEKAKNADRDAFFELITELARDIALEDADEYLVLVHRDCSEAKAIEHAERYNPRLLVDAIRRLDDGWEAIMTVRPEYVAYSYVNVADGYVYSRQVQDGAQMVDDERMKRDDPRLYAEITFELPWGAVILRPLESLATSTLADVQPYIYRGKPTVKLAAPRAAKDEELVEVQDA